MSSTKSKQGHFWISTALVVFACLLVGLLIKGLTLNPQNVQSALVSKPAKGFSVRSIQGASIIGGGEGTNFSLDGIIGKPIILNFWASWCVSCREEAKYFEAFWQKYRDQGIVVLGIAIQDTPEAALKFAETFGKTYPLGIDESGQAGIDYGVYGVPETFFIDRNGIIQHKEAGPMTLELLESKLLLLR
jgi:cytochrome c biogenesis protein CcmG/thiol:disulfide interchange protein DsbE